MWPFSRIRELEHANANLNRRLADWENQWMETEKLRNAIAIHNRALGRIIAKLDPMYGKSDFDPERRAESDRLADEVIARLRAEHAATPKT